MNPPPRTAVDAFLSGIRHTRPDIVLRDPIVRTYGDSEAMSRRIIAAILSGAKTGAFSPCVRFDRVGAPRPAVGQQYLVTTYDGDPRLVYELTHVEILPYSGIEERHLLIEGAEFHGLAVWRKFHWVVWSRELAAYGLEASEDMEIALQQFDLVYPARDIAVCSA